ncbi:hypothetical protein ACFLY6_02470 [Candidatus Dependentiae bacterium]
MRVNLTLVAQILSACTAIAFVRRFLIKPILSMVNEQEEEKNKMLTRIESESEKVQEVQNKIDDGIVKFRKFAEELIVEDNDKKRLLGEEANKQEEKILDKAKGTKDRDRRKLTDKEVDAFVRRVLDDFH